MHQQLSELCARANIVVKVSEYYAVYFNGTETSPGMKFSFQVAEGTAAKA